MIMLSPKYTRNSLEFSSNPSSMTVSGSESKMFLIGPGYIGREVIDSLVEKGEYGVTALVRREAAGKDLQNDSTSFVLGDLGDLNVIKQQTAFRRHRHPYSDRG
jgi:hypothetical protein